jgi:geranylgeranyl diphosphate synthase type I
MNEIFSNLAGVLKEVRLQAVVLAQKAWPELGIIVDTALPEPMDPVALLPVATGIACGAEIGELIPVAATVIVAGLGLRILDDCADQDNPDALYLSIGSGRAMNAAAALCTVAACALSQTQLPRDRRECLISDYFSAFLQVCQGQDQEARGRARTLSEYQQVVKAKTVAAYEFAAVAGARIATADPASIARSKACGTNLGWMQQILDDIEALWFPEGPSDLSYGCLTFPVLYGLSIEHARAHELSRLCSTNAYNEEQICALLDEMDVRRKLMTLALDYRDNALASLGPPLHSHGPTILKLWLDWLFRDGERLLGTDTHRLT